MEHEIRVLICDDHAVVREGLRALISTEPDLTVVGEVADGENVVYAYRELKPDVTLLDMVMPRMNGVEAVHAIRAEFPNAHILVLTSFSDDELVFPAIKAGALGYLLKDSSPEELVRAIRDVNRGEASLHPSIARRLIQELNSPSVTRPPTEEPLTEREMEVLQLVAKGYSNEEIGEALVVSERTARGHVSSILSKLHLANRTQAALYALREGLAQLDDNSTPA
ncbi:MAG: response regulator transcription factor [Candidatus Promineofilum sp.]|nr:response regulator transcription factor [Promineifilum sp.]